MGWLRLRRSSDTALAGEVKELRRAVEALTAAHKKEAEQVKKLRTALGERDDASTQAAARLEAALHREVQRALEKQVANDARWQQAVRDVERRLKAELKWRKIFSGQLAAVIRRLCLPIDVIPAPLNLAARRFRLRSQNEEDGMLLALLEAAGWGGCRFVEIGCGASGGNAAVLAQDCGWSGLMVDAAARAVAAARARFAGNTGVQVVEARVTPENVTTLLAVHGFDRDVDVLSIDIDSYDYWVLQALTVSPRVLLLEYNALFGPERRVTIPDGQPLDGTPKGYGGASLAALAQLAKAKGYRLVGCEDAGVNAFFLREDVAPEILAVPTAVAWRPLRSRIDIADDETMIDLAAVVRDRGLPLSEV